MMWQEFVRKMSFPYLWYFPAPNNGYHQYTNLNSTLITSVLQVLPCGQCWLDVCVPRINSFIFNQLLSAAVRVGCVTDGVTPGENCFNLSSDRWFLVNRQRLWGVRQAFPASVSSYLALLSAHTVYLCVLYDSRNKERLFPYTALTDWFV